MRAVHHGLRARSYCIYRGHPNAGAPGSSDARERAAGSHSVPSATRPDDGADAQPRVVGLLLPETLHLAVTERAVLVLALIDEVFLRRAAGEAVWIARTEVLAAHHPTIRELVVVNLVRVVLVQRV